MATEIEGNAVIKGKGEENFNQKVVNRSFAGNSNKIRPEKCSLDLTIGRKTGG